jgi:triosephosphate isomerase
MAVVDYPLKGSQDCFWEERGAFTGQISPLQLKALKIKYSIIGHSERRATGETDDQVNYKLRTLVEQKITPILCVGFGTIAEEDDLAVVDVLKGQLELGLRGVDPSRIIVAYEPVWAISSGDPYLTRKTPTQDHAEKISLYIKTRYAIKTVLYGGSVNVFNAKGFLEQPHVDGLLVGGDSLIPKHFNQIINMEL